MLSPLAGMPAPREGISRGSLQLFEAAFPEAASADTHRQEDQSDGQVDEREALVSWTYQHVVHILSDMDRLGCEVNHVEFDGDRHPLFRWLVVAKAI